MALSMEKWRHLRLMMPTALTIAIAVLGPLSALAGDENHHDEGSRSLTVGAAANLAAQDVHGHHRRASSLVRRHQPVDEERESPAVLQEGTLQETTPDESTEHLGGEVASAGKCYSTSIVVGNASTPPCLEGVIFDHLETCTPECIRIVVDDSEAIPVTMDLFPDTSTLTCDNGTWTPSTFTCQPVHQCDMPLQSSIVNSANSTCREEKIDHDNLCDPVCLEGYVPFVTGVPNFDTLRCDNGTLVPMLFQCLTPSQYADAKATDIAAMEVHRRRRTIE